MAAITKVLVGRVGPRRLVVDASKAFVGVQAQVALDKVGNVKGVRKTRLSVVHGEIAKQNGRCECGTLARVLRLVLVSPEQAHEKVSFFFEKKKWEIAARLHGAAGSSHIITWKKALNNTEIL